MDPKSLLVIAFDTFLFVLWLTIGHLKLISSICCLNFTCKNLLVYSLNVCLVDEIIENNKS